MARLVRAIGAGTAGADGRDKPRSYQDKAADGEGFGGHVRCPSVVAGRVPAIHPPPSKRRWPGLRPAMTIARRPCSVSPLILIATGTNPAMTTARRPSSQGL